MYPLKGKHLKLELVVPPNGTIFGSRLESRKSHQKSTLTLTHKNIWSEGGFVFLISYMCFNACVSQQEGLLRGIREESWNQHRDLENHSGTFLEKLIQPIEAEWGNSHPSVCNTLFFYWAVFPLSLSLSQSLSLSHTHTGSEPICFGCRSCPNRWRDRQTRGYLHAPMLQLLEQKWTLKTFCERCSDC